MCTPPSVVRGVEWARTGIPGGTPGLDPKQFKCRPTRDGEKGLVANRIAGGERGRTQPSEAGEAAPEEAPEDKERRDEEAG